MAIKINEKAKKIINIVWTTIEVIIVVFLLLFSIMTIQSSSTKSKTNSLFGLSAFTVLTDSMNPEFKAGDMIFATKVDENQQKNLKKGDIICYWARIDVNNDNVLDDVVNTHRIHYVIPVGEEYNGFTYREVTYVTKGDNNDEVDTLPVSSSSVIAKYSFHIDNVGGWVNAAKQGNRYFFIVVLPLILLFIWNGYYVVKLIIDRQKEKVLAENSNAFTEEEKQKLLEEAKRQALEELRKELQENQQQSSVPEESTDTGNAEETKVEEEKKEEETKE